MAALLAAAVDADVEPLDSGIEVVELATQPIGPNDLLSQSAGGCGMVGVVAGAEVDVLADGRDDRVLATPFGVDVRAATYKCVVGLVVVVRPAGRLGHRRLR